jgi:hypothetical protein
MEFLNMSMPSFPKNGADMTRDEALTMIIACIAMEELALSHILNAGGGASAICPGVPARHELSGCAGSPQEHRRPCGGGDAQPDAAEK